ncbi:hypothetical protein [Amycolatopsis sp. NPDC098790]|uniref:hypothetical protein n=1 Tax=Amycolatopsis sp. NPDC098790 TaxID=3363939 RepID=UPI0037FFF897
MRGRLHKHVLAAAGREAARDLDRPDSDRTVWGHTTTFRPFACDALAGGLGIVGAELSARAVVDAVDEEFRSFTEPDGRKLLAHIDDAVEPGAGWWWTRVPVGGPARREMDAIVRNLS